MRFVASSRRGVAVFAVLAAFWVAIVGVSASSVLAATNLVSNGTFEGSGAGSLSGWGGSSGALSLVAGSGGGHAAQLTATAGASQTYAYTVSKPVTNAVAGAAYHLDAQVQSALAGQTVCLVLKEIKAGTTTTVASAQTCVSVTSAWQSFPTVGYTVQTSGDSLTVNVLEKPAVAGAAFSFDNVVLATGTAGPPDTTAPSIPQGVGAALNGRCDGVVVGFQ